MSSHELIKYHPEDKLDSTIEVRIEDESVWLTQAQMMELFDSTKQNISLHINNIFKENELEKVAAVKYSLTTAADGKKYNTAYYNLDVIISVGYRIKSRRGTQFRIWATKVLRNYLLKGYAMQQRVEQIEQQVAKQGQLLETLIQSTLPPKEGIFFDGQIFDAHHFVSNLVRKANQSLVLIDNYIDDSVLDLFAKRKKGVSVLIYTSSISKQLETDLKKFNAQYEALEIKSFKRAHDRFLIIDQKEIYHIGASLKDLGKKPVVSLAESWFAFSRLSLEVDSILKQLNH
jgi:hypothetical protein